MEKIMLVLPRSKKEITINIFRKKMKNVSLKVQPSGEVKVSAPHNVSLEWITQYVKDKSRWIEKKLNSFKKTTGIEAIRYIKSGISTKYFG